MDRLEQLRAQLEELIERRTVGLFGDEDAALYRRLCREEERLLFADLPPQEEIEIVVDLRADTEGSSLPLTSAVPAPRSPGD